MDPLIRKDRLRCFENDVENEDDSDYDKRTMMKVEGVKQRELDCNCIALQMKAYFETYQLFFRENLPQLYAHFSALQVTPDIYIIDWSALVAVLTSSLVLVPVAVVAA